jgi:hypothetical protein
MYLVGLNLLKELLDFWTFRVRIVDYWQLVSEQVARVMRTEFSSLDVVDAVFKVE